VLHRGDWEAKEIEEWRAAAVDDTQQYWCAETGEDPFSTLRLLRHSLEFAERYRFLGRASEALVESYHYKFKRVFHHHGTMNPNVSAAALLLSPFAPPCNPSSNPHAFFSNSNSNISTRSLVQMML